MPLNLNIPITQTLTLPDNWQACKTPQELSYWIIAKFEGFTSSLTDINNALSSLNSMIETNTDNIATNDAEIAEIKTSIANINTAIGEINTSIETLNNNYGLLHSNYMAMNNRLATVEDVAGDIPTIKTDITELQSNVASNTEMVNTLISIAPIITHNRGPAIIDLTESKYRNHPHIIIDMPLNSSNPRPIIRVPDILNWEYAGDVVFDIFYRSTDNVAFSTIDASSPYISEDIYNLLPNNPLNNPINAYTKMELAGMTGNPYGLALRVIAYKSDSDGVQYAWCLL